MDYANNIEFEGYGKKSAVVSSMFIKVDEDNKILVVSDVINTEYIDTSSEGILKEVNSDIAHRIEEKLNINIADYGVEIFNDFISASNDDIDDLF